MRRSPPSGKPITTSTLRPSITSVPSSVQRIEASAAAATRACAALARKVGASTEIGHQRFEMVALQCRHMIGLGRGEQHPVDAGAEQPAQQASPAEAEGRQDRVERQPLIGKRLFAGIERAQHVDEHDLAIDIAGELRKERLDDRRAYRPRTALSISAARLPGACPAADRQAAAGRTTGSRHRQSAPGFKNRPGCSRLSCSRCAAGGEKGAVELVRLATPPPDRPARSAGWRAR